MPKLRPKRVVLLLGGALAVTFTTASASAFERQWHFGADAGIALANGTLKSGPALGVHAAYGLSDVFDLRLELGGSQQTIKPRNDEERKEPLVAELYAARLGLAYKLDVIQWIPYLGVTAGVLGTTADLPLGSLGPCLGLVGGLDYAATRSIGLGIAATADYALDQTLTQTTLLFRAEYRFGW